MAASIESHRQGVVPLTAARNTKTATIANGASLSGAIDIGLGSVVGVEVPASWTTAGLTFQGSRDGTNYYEVQDVNGAVSIANTVSVASAKISLDPRRFGPWRYIKIRSGTSGSPVTQGGARVMTLVYKSDTARMVSTQTLAFHLLLTEARKAAAIKDALGDTAGTNALGLSDTPGAPLVSTAVDGGGTASVTEKAAWLFRVPESYLPGDSLVLRVRAKLGGDVEVAQTLDAVVKAYGDGVLGSDICATAAQALAGDDTYADYDFTITPTGLVPGTLLYIELAVALDDTAGTANKFASIADVAVRCACTVVN